MPRVPATPDLLHPWVEQEEIEIDEEMALEIILGEDRPTIKSPRFVMDLGIGGVLQEGTELCIPKWSKEGDHHGRDWDANRRTDYTRATVSRIIGNIFAVPSNLDTANYRLDVFDYLLNDHKGFANFERVFQNLNSLIVQGLQREKGHDESVWTKVANYGLIFDITENYLPFGEGAPEALQRMDRYFKALKKSHSHKKMGELASKLSQPYDINLRIRIDPKSEDRYDNYPWVVSASVVRASEFAGEFGNEFKLDGRYESSDRYDESKKRPVRKILERAIELKYARHLADTAGHIASTLNLFEPMLIYMGYLRFMKQQQERGIEFSRPKFSEDGEIFDAKNPLVTTEPEVGNDIKYDSSEAIRVITGPNNGGKTVYVKTVGMIHALAQRGFYVPSPRARLRFVDGIYTHFVSPDDIANAEGRYKNEMRRMDEIFNTITPSSLVILDEPCGGTTLESGVKVSNDFLRAFGGLGTATYLTTHMSGVADAVNDGLVPRARNLHMHMEEDGTPTYQLREGASPMHYGEFIPNQMGLDYNTLSKRLARRAVDERFSFDSR